MTTLGIFTATVKRGFVAQLALWLWITVFFGNFVEAVAEGRGKAQAHALHIKVSDQVLAAVHAARRARGTL